MIQTAQYCLEIFTSVFFVCLLFRKRDRAHREIKNIFYKVIQKRRSSEEKADDILQTFMDSTYK